MWFLHAQKARRRHRGCLETMKLPEVAAQGKGDENFLPHREGQRDFSKCLTFDIVHDDQEIPFLLHQATYARKCYSPLGGKELTALTSREPIGSSSMFTDGCPTVVGVSLHTPYSGCNIDAASLKRWRPSDL